MASHISSVKMAKERGSFEAWDYEKEKDHKYLLQIMGACGESTVDDWKKYGRRNIANTTTAPVGSVSCLTQTTSGIEPAFLLSYSRRRKVTSDVERVDFVDDLGDKFQMYDVYHPGVQEWMDITGKTDLTQCPYYGGTSADVDWTKSVELQSVAQKWVDHSISKTCNLPSSASRELVADVYMRAWQSGCKGFTVYRDGCRDGVLVSKEEKPVVLAARNAPKRPEELECEIHRTTIKGEDWTILIGMREGAPYEVFGGLSDYVEIPRKYNKGRVKKRSRKTVASKYDLVVGGNGNEFVIKDIVSVFDNPNHTAFTRTLSLALRHGVPIHYLVEQLQKDKDADLFSFSKVTARVLKKYITDGTAASNGIISGCCETPKIVYQEGCATCLSCGYAKCG